MPTRLAGTPARACDGHSARGRTTSSSSPSHGSRRRRASTCSIRAVAAAGDPRLVLVLAGEGPERARLQARARELGVRLALIGDVDWDRIVEPYVVS